jgi:hypothetical protein
VQEGSKPACWGALVGRWLSRSTPPALPALHPLPQVCPVEAPWVQAILPRLENIDVNRLRQAGMGKGGCRKGEQVCAARLPPPGRSSAHTLACLMQRRQDGAGGHRSSRGPGNGAGGGAGAARLGGGAAQHRRRRGGGAGTLPRPQKGGWGQGPMTWLGYCCSYLSLGCEPSCCWGALSVGRGLCCGVPGRVPAGLPRLKSSTEVRPGCAALPGLTATAGWVVRLVTWDCAACCRLNLLTAAERGIQIEAHGRRRG